MGMIKGLMTQMDALPFAVRLWTGWMMVAFLSAALFVRRDAAARAVLGAFLLTMAVAMALFHATGTVRAIAVAHLLVWIPLLVHLARTRLSSPAFDARSPAGAWLVLVTATAAVSLVFDAREVVLYFCVKS